MIPVALTIAGSDPSGGAGVQADLKTFHAHGVYGEAVITLLTVQNTRGVTKVSPVDDALIGEQIGALWSDIAPHAAKTGALASAGAATAIAAQFRGRACALVVDPVLRPSEGEPFARHEFVEAIRTQLMPLATLITPNAEEAFVLTGIRVHDVASAFDAARALVALGVQAALVKGGHIEGAATDVLVVEDGTEMQLSAERIVTRHTHGTGCTYAAAITAQLALGRDLPSAVQRAKDWLSRALQRPLGLGKGHGPLNHFTPVSDR